VENIWEGFVEALRLLFGGDIEVYQIALRTLWVSTLALGVAAVIGVPTGAALALGRFWGRRGVVSLVNTGMGVPPVVVGLFVGLLLARNGPFGALRLLYSTQAMVIAQFVIALPIVIGLSLAAIQHLDEGLRLQIVSLGAGRLRTLGLLLREARITLMAALMVAYGALLSEVGAVQVVGGNIRGQTQVLTTGIVERMRAGQQATAIALAIILMLLVFGTLGGMTIIQQRSKRQ
jgi:tungstate transport system permease protein